MRSQPCERSSAPEHGEFLARLKVRRAELAEAILAGVQAVSGSGGDDAGAEYVAGARMAVAELLDYAIASIEQNGRPGRLPRAVVAQAKRAARGNVGLDIVLRRYAAADRQIVEFLMENAWDLPTRELRRLLRAHGLHADHFMGEVAREYVEEAERIARSPSRLAEDVERLLLGKPVDTAGFGYKLRGHWHIAVIAEGEKVDSRLRSLARSLGARRLLVDRGEGVTWAWLGSARKVCAADVYLAMQSGSRRSLSVAIGEPAEGLEGWRVTHSQARAALWVALHKPGSVVRYADDLLLVAAAHDDILARSLYEIYSLPLLEDDGSSVLWTTLRAYLATGCKAAAAASMLGVDRHTIKRRLCKVEERLGRRLSSCRAELELMLRMQELEELRPADRLEP